MVLAGEKTVTKLGKCLDSPFPYIDTLKKESSKRILAIFQAVSGFSGGCLRRTEPYQPSWSPAEQAFPGPEKGGIRFLRPLPLTSSVVLTYTAPRCMRADQDWGWSRERLELGGAPASYPSPLGWLWVIWEWQEWVRRDSVPGYIRKPSRRPGR